MLGGLGFENAYALAMPRAQAPMRSASARSPISRGRAPSFRSPATTSSSAGRNGRRSARPTASTFREQRQMQPEFMYQAVAHGEVDVIAGYTSDGRIAQFDLVVLDDPKHAIPPYDAVLLLSPQRANDAALRHALQPLIGAIDVAADARSQPSRVGKRRVARAKPRAGCGARSENVDEARSAARLGASQRMDAEVAVGIGPHRHRRPAGAARQRAERFDRILVAVLGVDGFAGNTYASGAT